MLLNVAQLQRLRAAGGSDGLLPTPQPRHLAIDGPSFADTLRDAVHDVDAAQKTADAQVEAFVAGEQENLHEVMIAMNQAELYLQLMTEVRNKMLETYQELMRMQV